jgi:hypothetical protein
MSEVYWSGPCGGMPLEFRLVDLVTNIVATLNRNDELVQALGVEICSISIILILRPPQPHNFSHESFFGSHTCIQAFSELWQIVHPT